jgi:hypothetical protein
MRTELEMPNWVEHMPRQVAEVVPFEEQDFWRWGRTDGDADYVFDVFDEVGGLFGAKIGAKPNETALVHCTKAGEQVVLDGLPALRSGGKVVTNDLSFAGSLHSLLGRQRAGTTL